MMHYIPHERRYVIIHLDMRVKHVTRHVIYPTMLSDAIGAMVCATISTAINVNSI